MVGVAGNMLGWVVWILWYDDGSGDICTEEGKALNEKEN